MGLRKLVVGRNLPGDPGGWEWWEEVQAECEMRGIELVEE